MSGVTHPMTGTDGRETILWQGTFLPGHESCRLSFRHSRPHLEGVAVFSHESLPCRLDYRVVCDKDWQTESARVKGWVGGTSIDVHLESTSDRRWLLDGLEQPDLAGCIDVDLNFSPSTNLFPIRRLNLAIGETAQIRAAWIRFPGFRPEPLEQRYTRLSQTTYRYESANGKFVAELKVDPSGFVTDYPGIWRSEALYEDPG